eukprot:3635451-Rhodomonas_salina.3
MQSAHAPATQGVYGCLVLTWRTEQKKGGTPGTDGSLLWQYDQPAMILHVGCAESNTALGPLVRLTRTDIGLGVSAYELAMRCPVLT